MIVVNTTEVTQGCNRIAYRKSAGNAMSSENKTIAALAAA